jgi:hypothetical protein
MLERVQWVKSTQSSGMLRRVVQRRLFRKNVLPPSSGSESYANRVPWCSVRLIVFDSEDRGSMFLRNMGAQSDYTASHHGKGAIFCDTTCHRFVQWN